MSRSDDEIREVARLLRDGLIRPEQIAAAFTEWLDRPESEGTTLVDLIRERGGSPSGETTQPRTPSPVGPSAGPDGPTTVSTALLGPPEPPSTDATTELGGGAWGAYPASGRCRYRRILQEGRGGIGVVWRAFDEHLGREVALKEPRPDRPLGPNGILRFLEEARVTGQLQHPGIVPLFDLVDDPASGGPFYTMRLVEGRTLQRAAREHQDRLGSGEAGPTELVGLLEAFVSVCQAVAYAHARGVLHRDLKGANVILGDFGEVHVLDWGLAKRSDLPGDGPGPGPGHGPRDLDGASDRDATQLDQAVGTPAYMAPEQTGRLPPGTPIDRRTDVYGLGAILYEILTGQAPFTAPDRVEVLRLVSEAAPEPPRAICPAAPAALEAVCLKALAKRPDDRYESASEVAAEVRRWLADEPVAAFPEPRSVRAARWARRHRPLVSGAAALLVAATAALGIGAAVVAAKNRSLAAARDDARAAAAVAVRAQQRAEDEQGLAEAHLASARALAMDMLRLSERAVAELPRADAIRKRLMDRVLETFREIHARRPDDPGLRHDLVDVYAEMAKVRQLLNELVPSTEAASSSIALLEGLMAEYPDASYYPNRLAEVLRDQASVLDILGRLGAARDALGRSVTISRARLEAAEGPEGGDDDRRTLGSSLLNLADLEARIGRLDASLLLCDEAIGMLRGLAGRPGATAVDPMLLNLAIDRRGRTLAGMGRAGEAESSLDEGIASCRAWLERTDGDVNHRYILGRCLDSRARLLLSLPGRQDDAEAAVDEAVEHRRQLIVSDGYAHYRADLAESLTLRGAIRRRDGRPDAALADLDAALDLLARLLKESPDVPAYLGHAGRLFHELGRVDLARDALPAAVRRLEIAVAFLRLGIEAVPEEIRDRRSLEEALGDLEAARRQLPRP